MQLVEREWDLSGINLSSDNQNRHPGLHVSTLSKGLEGALGKNPNPRGLPMETVKKYGELGFLVEDAIIEVLHPKAALIDEQIIRPGAVAFNGQDTIYLFDDDKVHVPEGYIIGTPDGVNTLDGYLEEFKAVYKSTSPLNSMSPAQWVDKERWTWKVNTLFYCMALGIRRVRFRVLFMVGNHKHYEPDWRIWESQEDIAEWEMRENFDMLVNYAREQGMMQ